jgi:hypothetical protein
MLWAVVGFLPGFVKPVFIGLLGTMLMEGMGWILEIPNVRLLTWLLGIWQVFPCCRDCGLCRGLVRLVVVQLVLRYGCHRGGGSIRSRLGNG